MDRQFLYLLFLGFLCQPLCHVSMINDFNSNKCIKIILLITGWWNQFQCIPYPNTLAVLVSSSLQGYDEEGRAMYYKILSICYFILSYVSNLGEEQLCDMLASVLRWFFEFYHLE